ncbi:MAG: NPCBM/NEW2 domain-containing protein, partial [Planctomycetes bacterium]|nr:NPCBM/NEW2 domain-containing protein [Planctomycetota bacterium]
VHRIDVRSKRIVFASDLDPVAIQQRAIATYPWSYRKDQNVLDGPLILAEQKYTKGLGVHAPCQLTYSIRQNYSTFAATIGIDEGMDGKGDCIFKVLGDGKVLFERRIRGEDKPHEIRVDISGHDRVTLAVEAGQNLDIGDNANWCEARFVQ